MIDISNLENEIANSLTSAYVDAQEKINTAADEITKELSNNLKADSPKNTGKYSKGWAVTRDGNTFTVHNKSRAHLTHILENGHMNRNGTRTPGQTHIAPNEQKSVADFEEKVRTILEGGDTS